MSRIPPRHDLAPHPCRAPRTRGKWKPELIYAKIVFRKQNRAENYNACFQRKETAIELAQQAEAREEIDEIKQQAGENIGERSVRRNR